MNRRLAVVPGFVFAITLLGWPALAWSSPHPAGLAAPIGTAFTYQGQLKVNNQPVNGICDLQFGLFDAPAGGSSVGNSPQTVLNVAVGNGLYTVQLDFGPSPFTGQATWLELAPRCPAGSGSFTPLSPREPVTPAPNALFAQTASSATSATTTVSFSGGLAGDVTGTQGATVVSSVGGKSASAVAGAVTTVSAATSADTPSTLALRDASGNLSLRTLTLDANLAVPNTNGTGTVGVLTMGGSGFLHNFGSDNTFLGQSAGNFSLTGIANTGVGRSALTADTAGGFNTAVGQNALLSNNTGDSNTAVGVNALRSNTTGTSNTALGRSALFNNAAGLRNTAIGLEALAFNAGGNDNTAIGDGALSLSANGFSNTALGSSALFGLNNGNGNIAIGQNAGVNYPHNESQNILIGNDGIAGDSNTIRLGSSAVHTQTFVAGVSGVPVTGGVPVVVSSAGQLGVTPSSRRFKDNIADLGAVSTLLSELRPVSFQYKPEYGGGPDQAQVGLIAEEVAEVAPWLVVYDDEGQPFTVRYDMLAPLLLGELQAQQRTIAQQASEQAEKDAQLAAQEAEIAALQAQQTGLAARLTALEQAVGQ